MSIKPISLLFNDDQTIADILYAIDGISIVCISENNVEHAYIGEDDIAGIDLDILQKRVVSCLVVKQIDGYRVHIEI